MRKTKIGSLFLVAVLALAGIGMSYAAWTDEISIQGSVVTADFGWDIEYYSGTWVYKDVPAHGCEIYYGNVAPYGDFNPGGEPLPENYLYVASAYARAGDPGQEEADVFVVFDNIFPCVPFKADLGIKYDGTIPARMQVKTYTNNLGDIDDYTTIEIKVTRGDEEIIVPMAQIEGFQLKPCDHIHVDMIIHLPQDNDLTGLEGDFYLEIGIIQWNNYIEPNGNNNEEVQD